MLVIENLTKRYGKFTAVDHLNMQVKKGEIFGFVGPNGAGKTTTLKIVATVLAPTSGCVKVDGIDAACEPLKVRGKIGYMPDFFGVYDNLKVMEYLDFYGSAYGLTYKERRKAAEELLDLVGLGHKKDSYVDSLSRGMKQRLCLARSLIHDPELLVLDEPASGLDPGARIEIKAILRELKNMGKTILISSHILPELAEICDTVGIIDKGRMVIQGSVEEIMRKVTGKVTVRIEVMRDLDKAVRVLKEQPVVIGISKKGNALEVDCEGGDEDLWRLVRVLVNQDIPVISFEKAGRNLEKVFVEVISGEEKSFQ